MSQAQSSGVIVIERSNSLGLAGMVLSLVGWVTCGVLCPIGFILSFIGLFKSPRGMAIVGVIVGGLGSLFFMFVGAAIVAGFFGLGIAVEETGKVLTTHSTMTSIDTEIHSYFKANGQLPTVKELRTKIDLKDGWGKEIEYQPGPNKSDWLLISPGLDGKLGTDDDIEGGTLAKK